MLSETVWPDDLFLDLDRTGPVPLYFQISQLLGSAIRSGRIESGARFENEISIGKRLGLSRPTVRRAMQELVDQGLVVRQRGIGTQVVGGHVTRPVEFTSLYEDLERASRTPTTRVLELGLRPASAAIADRLALPPGSDVAFLRRVRLSDGIRIAVLENHLPADFSTIPAAQFERHGLYQLMRARGVLIRIAKQRIGARIAVGDESGLLGIDADSPVLTVDRLGFDTSGRAFEYGRHAYRPDMYSFETTLVAK